MINAKTRGGEGVVAVEEPDDTNVIDLMATLQTSLKGTVSPAPKRQAA